MMKILLFVVCAFIGGLFGMEEHRELIKATKIKIALEDNKDEKKYLNKTLTKLILQKKEIKLKELEKKCMRLPVYTLLSRNFKENGSKVWVFKHSDEKGSWAIDDVRLDDSGEYILWGGRYGRRNNKNIGMVRLFKIDEYRNCVAQGSIAFNSTRCDGVVGVFNEKSPKNFGFFANGMQSDKEYGLVRWCKSFCDKKENSFSILSQYYNLGLNEGVMSVGQFSPINEVLAFARGSTLFYHQRSDDYPNLTNTTISIDTRNDQYGTIFDMQFSPRGNILGLVHEKGNCVSLYKTLSTKMNRLEIEKGVLQEFNISSNGKVYVTTSYVHEDKSTLLDVYDAQTLKLKATCKILGILYNDGGHVRKSYFTKNDELFVVHTVYNGRIATVIIDPNSWKVSQTIVHGKERNKRLFKIAGSYGTFIHNNKKKVSVFDVRNSGKVDEVAVNSVPEFAFIRPEGYIITSSKDGNQPNIEIYTYQN